jgi:hypothetical protein
MLTAQEYDSPAKIFLKAGKDRVESLLRSKIVSEKKAHAIAALCYEFDYFGIAPPGSALYNYIDNLLAAWGGVRGFRSVLALQMGTGVISENLTSGAGGFQISQRDKGEQKQKDKSNNNKGDQGG